MCGTELCCLSRLWFWYQATLQHCKSRNLRATTPVFSVVFIYDVLLYSRTERIIETWGLLRVELLLIDYLIVMIRYLGSDLTSIFHQHCASYHDQLHFIVCALLLEFYVARALQNCVCWLIIDVPVKVVLYV